VISDHWVTVGTVALGAALSFGAESLFNIAQKLFHFLR
jgi:hypothetical protein